MSTARTARNTLLLRVSFQELPAPSPQDSVPLALVTLQGESVPTQALSCSSKWLRRRRTPACKRERREGLALMHTARFLPSSSTLSTMSFLVFAGMPRGLSRHPPPLLHREYPWHLLDILHCFDDSSPKISSCLTLASPVITELPPLLLL